MIKASLKFIIPVGLLTTLISCSNQPTETETIEIEETETATNELSIELGVSDSTSNGVQFTEDQLSFNDAGWAAYAVDVPESGRYKVSFSLMASNDSSQVWIEDHIDNVDDRTYNITSNIDVPGTGLVETVYRDGSPMRAGNHKIKIHSTGAVNISGVTFELIRKHETTPKTYTQNMEGSDWEIVWGDEFDGTGIPDTSKWTFDIGNWGWGNGELQYYTKNRTKNARQEDGNLIIEAHKNDMGYPWTSARLTTRGKTAFLYGKIEFRAKVPAEKGNWAAGWTLGDNYVDELSWPYCGEIDILESVGYQMDNETGNGTAHASAHCGAYYFKLGNQPTATIDVENMNNEFHTYTVVWTPESITAFVDDIEYFKYDDTSTELSWPFDQSQNLILNLTMGGGWGGLQGMDESVDLQQLVVDYIRVYQRVN
ncbi:MAG: family 16 glycosylhydrolase [Bacteroidota bacterium]